MLLFVTWSGGGGGGGAVAVVVVVAVAGAGTGVGAAPMLERAPLTPSSLSAAAPTHRSCAAAYGEDTASTTGVSPIAERSSSEPLGANSTRSSAVARAAASVTLPVGSKSRDKTSSVGAAWPAGTAASQPFDAIESRSGATANGANGAIRFRASASVGTEVEMAGTLGRHCTVTGVTRVVRYEVLTREKFVASPAADDARGSSQADTNAGSIMRDVTRSVALQAARYVRRGSQERGVVSHR